MMAWLYLITSLLFAPLFFGIVNRTKAIVGGRKGQPLLQSYYDIQKLLWKGAAISKTTTWIFVAGPIVTLCSAVVIAAMVPFGKAQALLAFPGDVVLFAYLFALARFFTVLAALDTGSSFEGMGASREMQFSTLAEVAFFISIGALARISDSYSISGILCAINFGVWMKAAPVLILVLASLFLLLLSENSRIPVDDPITHLELTMIHEVMVLDHGGPDFAIVTYSSALKLWIFASIVVGIALPLPENYQWAAVVFYLAGMAFVAVLVGLVESTMARLKLFRVPQLLIVASALSIVALAVTFSVG